MKNEAIKRNLTIAEKQVPFATLEIGEMFVLNPCSTLVFARVGEWESGSLLSAKCIRLDDTKRQNARRDPPTWAPGRPCFFYETDMVFKARFQEVK